MQTAPTSPSNRTTNDGSTAKIRYPKEAEYASFIREETKSRKGSMPTKRPSSHNRKNAKISIKKNNSSPGNSKMGRRPKLEGKRISSNFPGTFYITPTVKCGGKTNHTFMLPKGLDETFIDPPRRRRNTGGLNPSKTQHEKHNRHNYNSGRGSGTGPIKVGIGPVKTGNGS